MTPARRLNDLLDDFLAQGAVGAALSWSWPGEEVQTVTRGLADRARGIAVDESHLFKIGSCTKTFVAATLMRLVAAGKVDLDGAAARWFPDLPGGERLRVRHLINHRGGLPEFEFDVPMTAGRVWSPQDLVDLAFEVRPQTAPDQGVVYNNTGYVLAGMLIEAVTGRPLGGAVRDEVLTPLGLADTWSAATEDFPAARLVRGYYHRPEPAAGEAPPASVEAGSLEAGAEMWRMEGVLPYSDDLQDSTALFPFGACYAAGDMVATSGDLARFLTGLFSGALLPPALMDEMTGNLEPASFPGTRMRKAGAGVFQSDYGGRATLGHQGSIPGYVTVMQHDPVSGLTLAMTSNAGSGNRQSFHAAGIHKVVDAAMAVLG